MDLFLGYEVIAGKRGEGAREVLVVHLCGCVMNLTRIHPGCFVMAQRTKYYQSAAQAAFPILHGNQVC